MNVTESFIGLPCGGRIIHYWLDIRLILQFLEGISTGIFYILTFHIPFLIPTNGHAATQAHFKLGGE